MDKGALMISDKLDYRKILSQEFRRRMKRNLNYSLRAFSRDLNISSSSLSKILRGEQGLSPSMARKICSILNFDENKSQLFCDLVTIQDGRNHLMKGAAQKRIDMHLRDSNKNVLLNYKQELTVSLPMFLIWLEKIKNDTTAMENFEDNKSKHESAKVLIQLLVKKTI